MTRKYITFSIDMECGETELTEGSRKIIEELESGGTSLFCADVLGDIHGIAEGFYKRSLDMMLGDWAAMRAKAGG